MEIKTLKTTITSIDKIFHISDIHIRTLKRHKEYEEVFENLFLHIAQHATNQSICVCHDDSPRLVPTRRRHRRLELLCHSSSQAQDIQGSILLF